MYADDVCLHSDGTLNEPKYTQLSRLQHLIADRAEVILSQDFNRTLIPYWNGTSWIIHGRQAVYSYPPSTHFVLNQLNLPVIVLFRNQNISMDAQSVHIYDDNMTLLWDSASYGDTPSGNTEIIPIVIGPLEWYPWSEPTISNLPVITSVNPLEQLSISNDETIYLWYRRNVTLQQAADNIIVTVETRTANALLFFCDGQYLGEYDNHDHAGNNIQAMVALDLSHFKTNQQYLFEILSVSLGLNNGVSAGSFELKGVVGNVWIDEQFVIR
jgi:hypothetical protein